MPIYIVKSWYKKKGKTYQGIWVPKTFTTTPTSFSGGSVWTYGTNTYFSYGGNYVLDESASTWTTITFRDSSGKAFYPSGDKIWIVEDNIYYSYYNTSSKKYMHYVFDKSTSLWSAKTWNGYSSFAGSSVWTDGTDYYLTFGGSGSGYILNKETSTWVANQETSFRYKASDYIWKDEEGNVYYSRTGTDQGSSSFDKLTKTWTSKSWYWSSGTSGYPEGNTIWTDGNEVYSSVYYSSSGNTYQYVLDKQNSTWLNKSWTGLYKINSYNIWRHKDHIYHTSSSTTYELT